MEHWVALVTQIVAVVIDAMAVVVIAIGTIEGFITGVRAMFFAVQGHDMRRAWLRYTRWLVAGLTFPTAPPAVHWPASTALRLSCK